MKKILLIGTGGTIAEDISNGNEVMLTAESLVKSVRTLGSIASVEAIDFMKVPSPAIQFNDVLGISKKIRNEIHERKFDGVVVTVGTDTLEEAAYFLDLALDEKVPVVITGSMRSRIHSSSDTDYNLETAVLAAASDELEGVGAVVVMNGEIHQAKYVSKTNTSSVASFQSPGYGPIGVISGQKVILYAKPISRAHIRVDEVKSRVDLLTCCVGIDGSLVRAAIKLGADGLVVEAFGGGDVTPSLVPALEEAISNGLSVVLVSRCITGPITEAALDFEGSAKSLEKKGVILASNTSGVKARIKLVMALSAGVNGTSLKQLFEN